MARLAAPLAGALNLRRDADGQLITAALLRTAGTDVAAGTFPTEAASWLNFVATELGRDLREDYRPIVRVGEGSTRCFDP